MDDAAFLGSMLAEAAAWNRPPERPAPPLAELLTVPRIADYIEGWGRDGDGGVIAESGGVPVGACWFRRFSATHPGCSASWAPMFPGSASGCPPSIGEPGLERCCSPRRSISLASEPSPVWA